MFGTDPSCFTENTLCRLKGLVCQHRVSDEPVYGCVGVGEYGVDYCILPPEDTFAVKNTSKDTVLSSAIEAPNNDIAAASEPGTARPELPVLQTLGADGIFDVYPLGMCQGSCFNDRDCVEGLYCYMRYLDEDVPGCSGSGHRTANYCTVRVSNAVTETAIDDDNDATEAPTTINAISSINEDSTMDNQNAISSIGEELTEGPTTIAAIEEDELLISINSTYPRLTIVGNDGIFDSFPLQACMGDCDQDEVNFLEYCSAF